MTTELFLGGLMILTMAGIVILALTHGSESGERSNDDRYDAIRKARDGQRDDRPSSGT